MTTKEFIDKSVRVIQVMHKPSHQEMQTIIKVTAFGLAGIGFIGFVVYAIEYAIRFYNG